MWDTTPPVDAPVLAPSMPLAQSPCSAQPILSLGIDVARWFRPGGPYTPDGPARLYSDLAVRMLRPSAPDRPPQ